MSTRTLIPWMGGKYLLCNKILREVAQCDNQFSIKRFIEPCVGGGRVLLNKAPHQFEIINDVNEELMILWATVKHPDAHAQLIDLLRSYPYSRDFFMQVKHEMECYKKGQLQLGWLTIAAYMYVLTKQSMAAGCKSFKEYEYNAKNAQARNSYLKSMNNIRNCHHRIKNVEIRKGDYISMMREFADDMATLFYIDPPYWGTKVYGDNLSNTDHERLVDFLSTTKCKIILSGYDIFNGEKNVAYQRLVDEFGWTKIFVGEIAVSSSVVSGSACRKANEYIWVNY